MIAVTEEAPKQPKQGDFWECDERFVRVLFSMIDNGGVRAMGPNALACLLVIRRRVPYHGVSAFPSAALIAKETDLSKPTVYKAIDRLETLGWLEKIKSGRKNIYRLSEQYIGTRVDGQGVQHQKIATMPYGPKAIQDERPNLAKWKKTGILPEGSNIIIHDAVINVEINNFYEGSKQIKQEISVKVDEHGLEHIESEYFRERARLQMERLGAEKAQEILNASAAEDLRTKEEKKEGDTSD